MTMRRRAGELAPRFAVEDIDGETIDLLAYRDRRILLAFFRYGGCPLCNLRMAFLTGTWTQWSERGLVVIAVFESPRQRLLETVASAPVPFPVIPDPSRELYRLYGVSPSTWGTVRGALRFGVFREAFRRGFRVGRADGLVTQLPAEFLIGPEGKIQIAYYGRDIGDHLPIEEIDRWLDDPGQT